jgi:hypothetical protein
MGIEKSSIKIILSLVFWQGLGVLIGKSRRQKTARFRGLLKPSGEVQICRISANRAIIGCILHTNRKEWIYGVLKKEVKFW